MNVQNCKYISKYAFQLSIASLSNLKITFTCNKKCTSLNRAQLHQITSKLRLLAQRNLNKNKLKFKFILI